MDKNAMLYFDWLYHVWPRLHTLKKTKRYHVTLMILVSERSPYLIKMTLIYIYLLLKFVFSRTLYFLYGNIVFHYESSFTENSSLNQRCCEPGNYCLLEHRNERDCLRCLIAIREITTNYINNQFICSHRKSYCYELEHVVTERYLRL